MLFCCSVLFVCSVCLLFTAFGLFVGLCVCGIASCAGVLGLCLVCSCVRLTQNTHVRHTRRVLEVIALPPGSHSQDTHQIFGPLTWFSSEDSFSLLNLTPLTDVELIQQITEFFVLPFHYTT